MLAPPVAKAGEPTKPVTNDTISLRPAPYLEAQHTEAEGQYRCKILCVNDRQLKEGKTEQAKDVDRISAIRAQLLKGCQEHGTDPVSQNKESQA